MSSSPLLYRSGARLAGAYLTDGASLLSKAVGEDVGPSIAFSAILVANVGAPGDLASNSGWEAMIRNPVSVYRLAQDLGQPYETVRRYALRLEKKSLVSRSENGLRVEPAVLVHTPLAEFLQEMAAMSIRLHDDLQDLGAKLSTVGCINGPVHNRRVQALSVRYFLRGVEIATKTLGVGPVPSMIQFSIHRANLAHLGGAPLSEVLDPNHVHLDAVRRPVSVFAIAKALNLPYETARRHVVALVKRGLVVREADEGYIVPSELLTTQPLVECVHDTMASTLEFLETAFSPSLH